MDGLLEKIEKALEPAFAGLPSLPTRTKAWLVKAWPLLAIILGILQLLAAWSLWHIGHVVSSLVTYSNAFSQAYGTGATINSLGFFYWLGLFVLVIDGIILLAAYPGLKERRKAGWNMLFLASLVNVVYGVASLFDSNYGGVSKLVGTLIGSAIGFYLLLQIRSAYMGKITAAASARKQV